MLQIKKFTVNYFSENTYIVYDEKEKNAIIIDCGAYGREEKQDIYDFIQSKHLSIEHLLNTHMHLDHSFGIPFLHKMFGLNQECSKKDLEGLPEVKEQARLFGIGFHEDNFPQALYIKEGDKIQFNEFSFEIISVPGHSPEGLCFYIKQADILFSGDSLFKGGIGRADLWGGNELELITSIKTKLLNLPEKTEVYPGHGETTNIGDEKRTNPYLT